MGNLCGTQSNALLRSNSIAPIFKSINIARHDVTKSRMRLVGRTRIPRLHRLPFYDVPLNESQLAFSNLGQSRGREIDKKNYHMALKFGWRLRNTTAETPVKLQSHPKTPITDLAASRLNDI